MSFHKIKFLWTTNYDIARVLSHSVMSSSLWPPWVIACQVLLSMGFYSRWILVINFLKNVIQIRGIFVFKFLFLCASAKSLQLYLTLWSIACQASLSMRFSRWEYWSELLCPSPWDLPDPGIKPMSLASTCIGKQVLYH